MSVFQFKQFKLNQTDSAAKLTTDATIFGAWLPFSSTVKQALEIGTGTGILSLMLAQRSDIKIEALEIEERACAEAVENFNCSPWKSKLKASHIDFRLLYEYSGNQNKYDLVFSNPPFFTKNLQSPSNKEKNLAYHTDSLSLAQLACGIALILKKSGEAFVMLPSYEMTLFENEMKLKGLFVNKTLKIHHNLNKPSLRVIHGFSEMKVAKPEEEVLYIRDENNEFHPRYAQLLQPFLTIF
jgi:tRNA1Val (adenine37-N6)-methyltransferase